jgi:DNA polymerase-3 subunit epsilon
VTFVVVDLETAGMSPAPGAITEIGAVKLRGGECLGTFQTMVRPDHAIPSAITALTGITDSMVAPAPGFEAVLPLFLEFLGRETVIVGHNVRFDLSFLHAAAEAFGYPPFAHPFVDTCAIARRLVRDEVANCKLGTLAYRFQLASTPTHRALDDAMATGELLHCLLERTGTLGVTALDDLLVLPEVPPGPQLQKLRLATALPHRAGRFLFEDRARNVLLDGEADDVHHQARSYFLGAPRKRITQLLRQTMAIDYVPAR